MPPTISPDALSANQVTVEFSGLRALDDVSVFINPREILGLIGPNGSGKTTLINAITGQVPFTKGEVKIAQSVMPLSSPRKVALSGIARTFQIVRLFDQLTVWENVETAALAKGVKRKTAREIAMNVLQELGMAERVDSIAASLSYGDKRRVEIARALASDPRFLLLDEPAAGMNENESHALCDQLLELPKKRDLGILIIDHDVPLISRLCDRVHVIASGKTIAAGLIEDVRKDRNVIEAYLGSSARENP
jgi:branched-chain amino acid transport system ATP-binding protein